MVAERDDPGTRPGPIAWMARRRVPANLLMAFLLVGGALLLPRLTQEVFPEIRLDMVTVRVVYPGASPEEIEEGIVLAIEEVVRGIDGVDEVRATAREGVALVRAELRLGADDTQALDDIKSAVDRIATFPADAEEPVISLSSNRRQVLSLIVSGPEDRRELDHAAERVREALRAHDEITQVDIAGLPPPEIEVAIEQATLRRYRLTPARIAARIDAASVEIAGGDIDDPDGETSLRVASRRKTAAEVAAIMILADDSGELLRLGEIATVRETFRETDRWTRFNGQQAARVRVYRVGDQTPLSVSDAVDEVLRDLRDRLPPTVELTRWNDSSEMFRSRVGLLVRNGILGLALVLVVLGVFLDLRLALWVTLGIPISFLGAVFAMSAFGISINMISLFAFILVLGIVVDDAIVVAEAAFEHHRRGCEPLSAAIAGTRSVALPVVFAVLTSVVAFVPLLLVPGTFGKFFINIPSVVIPILLLSLIEAFFILPTHIGHALTWRLRGPLAAYERFQHRIANGLEGLVERHYRPLLAGLIRWRYAALAVAAAFLIAAVAYVSSDRISFTFLPRIEHDIVGAEFELPSGTAPEQTQAALERLTRSARTVLANCEEDVGRGVLAELGITTAGEEAVAGGRTDAGAHLGSVAIQLTQADTRDVSASQVAERWREHIGTIPGARRLSLRYTAAASSGADISIRLAHDDQRTLENAARRLAAVLQTYRGVRDVDPGFDRGQPEIRFELLPAGRSAGLTERDLAMQIRGAYFGAEALRLQRNRDELRIYVRRPRHQRDDLNELRELELISPTGEPIPLRRAARLVRTRAYTSIQRDNGQRVITVSADTDRRVASANAVTGDLATTVMPKLLDEHPGLAYEVAGTQEQRRDAMGSLIAGLLVALVAMYALMATAFNSYVQPVIIVAAVPFGLVGALAGHVLLGFDISLVSILGLVALAGVVVNDSLVLTAEINRRRAAGAALRDAVIAGGTRRFRPVLLTSLTTFFGLAPMIFATSTQARFLVPMALSLGFGVLFVTLIALCIVPLAYIVLEDLQRFYAAERR